MAGGIVVTGMGIASALGCGKAQTMRALFEQQCGIGPIRHLQTSHTEFPVGEVPMSDEEMRHSLLIPVEQITTRTPLIGMMALREAAINARLHEHHPHRMAFINGITVGGMEKSEQYYQDFFEGAHTQYIAQHDCGASTESIADYWGGFEVVTTISTACSSAANAVVLGARLIENGRVDVAVVGGTEGLSKFHFNGFQSLMILDKAPCKPFDRDRAGLNLGEGASYLVLESEEHANRRGVMQYCRLSGYGNRCDAFHQTASSDNGEGAYLAMRDALQMAHLQPDDIDYINAHGTGTPNNDASESAAIRRIFGNRVPYISSTKAFTGHTTSAAGAVEAVISILSMRSRFVPANLNFQTPMEGENPIIPVTKTIAQVDLQHILTNSFGFGGNDTSLIFSKI